MLPGTHDQCPQRFWSANLTIFFWNAVNFSFAERFLMSTARAEFCAWWGFQNESAAFHQEVGNLSWNFFAALTRAARELPKQWNSRDMGSRISVEFKFEEIRSNEEVLQRPQSSSRCEGRFVAGTNWAKTDSR